LKLHSQAPKNKQRLTCKYDFPFAVLLASSPKPKVLFANQEVTILSKMTDLLENWLSLILKAGMACG
jgi:hypothetical protein